MRKCCYENCSFIHWAKMILKKEIPVEKFWVYVLDCPSKKKDSKGKDWCGAT